MKQHSRYVETNLKPYRAALGKILALVDQDISDDHARQRQEVWKAKARQAADAGDAGALQATLEQLLPEVYAMAGRIAHKAFGWTVFDSQYLGAIAMHRSSVIELDTGEGKTLAAAMVACLQALAGRGVHVLTFNDYLAKRDAAWMRPIYEGMGLTVDAVQQGMSLERRKAAYACDVTYLTAKEAGFDYLRSFLALSEDDFVQRPFHSAIIDEADSIMIDEARIPLIIAGDAEGSGTIDPVLYRLASQMQRGSHYRLDARKEHILITEAGAGWLEKHLGVENLYDEENVGLLTRVRLVLQAHALLKRDVDYIVRDGRIELVDEFTGRVIQDRQLPEGLHEAVEVKEGLRSHTQGRILNRITLRDFLSLYGRLCGMTGTAWSAAPELKAFYGLTVTRIPPHTASRRIDRPDLIYRTKEEKERAIFLEIEKRHRIGQPVLVGTASVEESERLADRVRSKGYPCEVLNARHDEEEAAIVAQAGQAGAITISTNMAGRGVDIRLGSGVTAGLMILGTNRHRSVRIDRQLRGRAGRQGDPGESRFFISLEDDLIVRYGVRSVLPPQWREKQNDPDVSSGNNVPAPIDDPEVAEVIRHTQRVMEGQLYQQRQSLSKYSVLVEEQRQQIHQLREDLVSGRETLRIWQSGRPERCESLIAASSESEFVTAQQQAGVMVINRNWSDYLELVERLLDHISLMRTGAADPWSTFQREILAAYEELLDGFEFDMLTVLDKLEVHDGRLSMDKAELSYPPMTRSYLIDDGSDALDWDSGLSGLIAASVNPTLYGMMVLAKWWKKRRGRDLQDEPW